MTVVDAFFILVGITSAALGSGLSPGGCQRQPRLCAAGHPETPGVGLGYNQGIENTFAVQKERVRIEQFKVEGEGGSN